MLRRLLQAGLLALCSTLLLMVGGFFYGYAVEPHWVEETHWVLHAPHWKGRPLKLAVLADLHARRGDGDYLDDLVRRTLAAQPDAILMLGDYTNGLREPDAMPLPILGRHLAPLMQVPCYAVLGNHDCERGEKAVRHLLQALGAELLEGRLRALHVGGDTLYLSGVRCFMYYSRPGRYTPVPPPRENATYLLLTHSPSGAMHAPRGTTATLCGHTHGGQICLPGGYPLTKPDIREKGWELKGEMRRKGLPVYTTRGLGMSALPLRLFCRPELLFVELVGSTNEEK